MRVLDLGCGFGKEITVTTVRPSDEIIGVDLVFGRLELARKKFPARKFVQARGESLPFRDAAFHSIVCEVAIPYMNIPAALSEINRVLRPGGTVHLSLHAFRFTVYELTLAFSKPKALMFRLWVMTNGLILHLTGKPAKIRGRYESFQTRRGMSIALEHAGFEDISFSRPQDGFTKKLVVSARKSGAMAEELRLTA